MKATFSYFLRSNLRNWWIWVLFSSAIALILALIFVLNDSHTLAYFYDPILDPVVAIGTAIIALIIAVAQRKIIWEESLPKRLTVHFMYEGHAVLSCYEAFLSGASDVRAWSQQIGGQMAGVPHISFYPYIKSSEPVVTKSTFEAINKKPIDIMLFEAIFYLKSDKFTVGLTDTIAKPEIVNKYVIWLDNNPDTPGNIVHIEDDRPLFPFSIREALQAYTKKQKQEEQPVE